MIVGNVNVSSQAVMNSFGSIERGGGSGAECEVEVKSSGLCLTVRLAV